MLIKTVENYQNIFLYALKTANNFILVKTKEISKIKKICSKISFTLKFEKTRSTIYDINICI